MTSSTDKDEDKKKKEDSNNMQVEATQEEEETTGPPPIPPLQAAALRLDKSLTQKQDDYYSNPAKTVRRWLSTSSGAAAAATHVDISTAAVVLLSNAAATPVPGAPVLDLSLLSTNGDDSMQEDTTTTTSNNATSEPDVTLTLTLTLKTATTQVFVWLLSLKIRLLWKEQQHSAAASLCTAGIELMDQQLQQQSQRSSSAQNNATLVSFHPLLARLWRYQVLVTPTISPQGRTVLAQAHNKALLRRDIDTSTTLLNSMLHDLLQHQQVEQAQKLLNNSTLSTELVTNNQLCRYLYYSGRIQALRLEYTSSFSNLSQAMRKAPTNTALGFRITVQRLLVVVQLLMGEIPDRQVFFQTGMVQELEPYLHITQAVRQGDLAVFTKVVTQHKARLQLDETFTLISRLAHQVVKAGLRKLQTSYSRLSLQDVADRLGLASANQAEFVVAKAVRDGVLDATIDHAQGFVQSHDLTNIYATKEPAQAFHRRIAYCLTTHNDAVRSMRYPPDAYKKQLQASRGMRRRKDDDKTDEEKAQELEDELEDY